MRLYAVFDTTEHSLDRQINVHFMRLDYFIFQSIRAHFSLS